MDIKQVKARKKELEEEIRTLLVEFQLRSGVRVEFLHLTHLPATYGEGWPRPILAVEIVIGL